MKASGIALAALGAALLGGCAHGGAASEQELSRLREQVRLLQQNGEQDRRRLEALEAQITSMVRRKAEERRIESSEPISRAAPVSTIPGDLATVRVAPQPAPAPVPEVAEEEDSFIFIVDRGDGDDRGTSRPSRQARRNVGGPGVDKAPPLAVGIELRDPHEEPAGPDAYDAGVAALADDDLAAAAGLFERFLAQHPRDRRADNAALALGDVFRRQQLPGKALQAWERVATDYPAGDAVPDALLRYGETCRHLGRGAAARAAFQRLMQDYPGTEAAARAGAYLAEED